MHIPLLILLNLSYLFCQSNIVILTADKYYQKTNQFESHLISNVLDIYNKKYSQKYNVQYIKRNSVQPFYFTLDSLINLNKEVIAINHISNSKYKQNKYFVSPPYMYNDVSILKLKSNPITKIDSTLTLGYLQNGPHEKLALQYADSLNVKLNSIETLLPYIKSLQLHKADILIASNILASLNHDYNILEYVPGIKRIEVVLLFSKNSQIFDKFEPILKYYFSSRAYYSLTYKYFNNDFKESFKKEISD